MKKFYLVNLGNAGDWGVMVNEGTAEEPWFRVLFKATRSYAERLLAQLNADPNHGSNPEPFNRSNRTPAP